VLDVEIYIFLLYHVFAFYKKNQGCPKLALLWYNISQVLKEKK